MSAESKAKYTIINKDINNIEITGFTIENEDGKHKVVNKSDTIRLVRSGKIKNATTLLNTYSATYVLHINGGLKNLPYNNKSSNTIKLLGRLINSDKQCIGYKVQDHNGKTYRLSIQKVWELSMQGLIEDFTGKIVNNTKIIESSSDNKLIDLPKLYV